MPEFLVQKTRWILYFWFPKKRESERGYFDLDENEISSILIHRLNKRIERSKPMAISTTMTFLSFVNFICIGVPSLILWFVDKLHQNKHKSRPIFHQTMGCFSNFSTDCTPHHFYNSPFLSFPLTCPPSSPKVYLTDWS